MGLTLYSVGKGAYGRGSALKRTSENTVIALAGNPNVGKSTVFNGLTGMNQHTGNWPGKTVTSATGICRSKKKDYTFVDLPGTYSLMAHSPEEEVARNFICFDKPDATVVVCDATCLERNLNLVLQTLEITDKVIVCINLLDEARRKNIHINTKKLSEELGVPVIGITARKKKSLSALVSLLDEYDFQKKYSNNKKTIYPQDIENAILVIESELKKTDLKHIGINQRWLALRLLSPDETLSAELKKHLKDGFLSNPEIKKAIMSAKQTLKEKGISDDSLKDIIVSSIVNKAADICRDSVSISDGYNKFDRAADKILTGKLTAYPIMILLLMFVFWLTIYGANYPSKWLSHLLFSFQYVLTYILEAIGTPNVIHDFLVFGVYRVLAWVVSVMLPPMAIFFPLFTLLEDSGYLPRIAYNLDNSFKKCNACGKQALTMCMGFGCNAAGVVGCRIIDSPRERILAILTNNFVPCNGRFPTIIAIISMFFVTFRGGFLSSMLSSAILISVILLGIFMTFATTKLLSKTVLRGVPSSFALELPPYRRPQVGKVIIRSIFDRTLFVLGRSAAVAAPCGGIIWLLANIAVGGESLISIISSFLDPFASIMGLDGVILMAFILGLPANEIVVPIIIMTYLSSGSLSEMNSIDEMKNLFVANGWTIVTALNTMLFSLFHWPCSTTLITIYKETKSKKQTFAAFILPTAIGIILCIATNMIFSFFI